MRNREGLTPSPHVPSASRVKGMAALVTSLKRLRLRADRAAAYRRVSPAERLWCLRVADACETLLRAPGTPTAHWPPADWEHRSAQ